MPKSTPNKVEPSLLGNINVFRHGDGKVFLTVAGGNVKDCVATAELHDVDITGKVPADILLMLVARAENLPR